MKTEAAIREMCEDLDGTSQCLPGSQDLNYKGAPTRDEVRAYVNALSWALDEESDLPEHLKVLSQIITGEAEPLAEEEEEQDDSTDPH